jgi:hypothetical protein
MSSLKLPRIGLYGKKDRLLQKMMSFEKVSLTWKTANVYRYLGSEVNGENASINDIQDSIFMETPDRSYGPIPVEINISMDDLGEQPFDLSKFGIISPIGETQIFRVHVNSFDQDGLGRYLIVGDVIEIPFLQQNGNDSQEAFFEVTDVDRKMEFENFFITVTTVPVKDTQEMEDLPIPSNSDALGDLQTQLDAAFQEEFVDGGLDSEPYLYVDRDYVVDDYVDAISTITYNDPERTTYEPRANDDWLDDPNGKVF